MSDFSWGILIGSAIGLLLMAAAALLAYRRIAALQHRTLQAERLAELGTLTGGLAHEIKNPLSTIQLNLQLLQEDLDPANPSTQRVINRLATVQREATRLKEILDGFLRYAGKIELERKPVELNQLLEGLVDFYTPTAQLQHVQLRFQPHGGDVVANIDAKLIQQAILNLMINALHAMPQGGELILRLQNSDNRAVIDVIDTGSGISPDKLAEIFRAYYSTKAGGTGLGLAMTRRIVHEHGGQIEVKSDVGKGSNFTIRLPLQAL